MHLSTSWDSRTRSAFSRALALTIAALAAVGCSEPLGIEDVSGRYSMVRALNQPLPLEYEERPGEPRRLLNYYVYLRTDGNAIVVSREEELWGVGAPRLVERTSRWLYRVEGNQVILRSPPCPGLHDCAGPLLQMRFWHIGDALRGTGGQYLPRVYAPDF